jgi:hypothetical protein
MTAVDTGSDTYAVITHITDADAQDTMRLMIARGARAGDA